MGGYWLGAVGAGAGADAGADGVGERALSPPLTPPLVNHESMSECESAGIKSIEEEEEEEDGIASVMVPSVKVGKGGASVVC